MAFGAPIRPHTAWSIKEVWVPDKAATLISDQFALLPQQYAENYFSMDALIMQGYMCLGGPNFNKLTLLNETLLQQGYTKDEIDLIKLSTCQSDDAGYSETMLYRKLTQLNISPSKNTLGFSPFFLVVLRKNMRSFCQYLHPKCLLVNEEKGLPKLIDSSAYSGCVFMMDDARQNLSSKCNIATANTTVGTVTTVVATTSYFGNCILNKAFSDWNFLPFRLLAYQSNKRHYGNKRSKRITNTYNNDNKGQEQLCLTSKGIGMPAMMLPCLNSDIMANILNISYSIHQLFYFYPLDNQPQIIRNLRYTKAEEGIRSCLGVTMSNGTTLTNCKPGHPKQQFKIILQGRSKKLSQYKRQQNHHHQTTWETILEPKEIVMIENNGLYLSHNTNSSLHHMVYLQPPNFGDVTLMKRRKYFLFTLERAVLTPPTNYWTQKELNEMQ